MRGSRPGPRTVRKFTRGSNVGIGKSAIFGRVHINTLQGKTRSGVRGSRPGSRTVRKSTRGSTGKRGSLQVWQHRLRRNASIGICWTPPSFHIISPGGGSNPPPAPMFCSNGCRVRFSQLFVLRFYRKVCTQICGGTSLPSNVHQVHDSWYKKKKKTEDKTLAKHTKKKEESAVPSKYSA